MWQRPGQRPSHETSVEPAAHLGRQTTPTSSSVALPVDSPLPGFDGNGQYGGDFALSKRTVQVARGAESATWVYGGGQSLTLSELACPFG